jgi:hypothetical protein
MIFYYSPQNCLVLQIPGRFLFRRQNISFFALGLCLWSYISKPPVSNRSRLSILVDKNGGVLGARIPGGFCSFSFQFTMDLITKQSHLLFLIKYKSAAAKKLNNAA